MIKISGLTKRFGRLQVLQGVDLELVPGRVTAVVGPNGAGKTTLIKSILGLTRPDGGKILLDGRAFDSLTQASSSISADKNDWEFWEFFDDGAGKWRMLDREWQA